MSGLSQSPQKASQNANQSQTVTPELKKTAKGNNIILDQYDGAIEEAAEKVYEKRLFNPLHEAILQEFGVGGFATFRNKEVNTFRNIMKDTARQTSYDEIDNAARDSNDAQGNQQSMLVKLYNSNLAKKDAYAASKKNVDAAMSQKANNIISSVVHENGFVFDTVYDIIPTLDRRNKQEKVVKEFTAEADKYAKKLEPPKKKEAIQQAQNLVKQVISDNSKGAFDDKSKLKENATDSSNLVLDVSNSTKGVGEASYKKVTDIKEENVFSAFFKASQIVKQIVPNKGDSAEASFEISIPMTPFSSFIINIGASCEHSSEDITNASGTSTEQDYYAVGAEVNIGASGNISGLFAEAALKGTLGLFVEAKGKRPEEAMSLISYGIYRVLYTKSETLARSLWGNGGKTGFSKFEEAEIWASTIEKNILEDENTSVSVGAQATFSAEAKTTEAFKKIIAVSGEGEIKGQKFYEYSKKIIEEAGIQSPADLEATLNNLQSDPRIKKLMKPPGTNAQSTATQANTPTQTAGGTANNAPTNLKEVFKAKKALFKNNIHHKSKLSISAETELMFAEKAGFGCGVEGALTLNHSANSRDASGTADKASRSTQIEAIEFGISLKFPEGVEDLTAFNQIIPKASDYAAAIIGNTVNKASTDKEKVGVIAGREASLNTINTALQSYVSTLDLEDTPFEDSWGSDLTAAINFEFNFLEDDGDSIELEITRNQSHEFDFEVVNFSVAKTKTLFSKKLL